jgi:hypothetical protein
MVTIEYDDLSLAFDFVRSGAPMEHRAFVSLESGKVYWVSELHPVDEEERPDDLDTGRYLEIPHKNDLDLGRQLAFRFVEERLPGQSKPVADIFRSRGAYGRFKELLASEGVLRSGTRSRMRRPSRRSGSGARNTIFIWANATANKRPNMRCTRRLQARVITRRRDCRLERSSLASTLTPSWCTKAPNHAMESSPREWRCRVATHR